MAVNSTPEREGSLPGDIRFRIREACRTAFQQDPVSVKALPRTASERLYFRVHLPQREPVIAVWNEKQEENRNFFSIQRLLQDSGIRVPDLHYMDADDRLYLQEDLGDITLYDLLNRNAPEDPEKVRTWYRKAVNLAASLQALPADSLERYPVTGRQVYDREFLLRDLHYGKFSFLLLSGVKYDDDALHAEFDRLADAVSDPETLGWTHRDFNARNLMVQDGELHLIDFQGLRRGPVLYDIASLLWQTRAALPVALRQELFTEFLDQVCRGNASLRKKLEIKLPETILLRLIQTLGTYGFRGLYHRQSLFSSVIPAAVQAIARHLEERLPGAYPVMQDLFRRLASQYVEPQTKEPGGLRVRIRSFSYKKGYPADETVHGGGFVFDCRALPNPGREAEYRSRTGKDSEVIAYLESHEGTHAFLRRVKEIVDQAVSHHQGRGFDYLSIAFGCTGGQHRSVYFAEQLARHLQHMPGVIVELEHREAPYWPES